MYKKNESPTVLLCGTGNSKADRVKSFNCTQTVVTWRRSSARISVGSPSVHVFEDY
jgi:hypothetical protein